MENLLPLPLSRALSLSLSLSLSPSLPLSLSLALSQTICLGGELVDVGPLVAQDRQHMNKWTASISTTKMNRPMN